MTSDQQFEFWIVTPSYNQAEFISQTVQSVLDQKSDKFRYWVMDGKSSDATPQILKSFGRKLNWVSEKDGGQTAAINAGLRKLGVGTKSKRADTRSVIVAYINSDDYYLPGAFQKVADEFALHPTKEWLVGDCQIVDAKNREIQYPVRMYKYVWRWFPIKWSLALTNAVPQPAVFFRLSAVEKTGFFNEQLHYVMDYEYWWRLLNTVGEPIKCHTALAAFRIHGGSKGGSLFDRQFEEEYTIAQQFVRNPLLLFGHRLHTLVILTVYRWIK